MNPVREQIRSMLAVAPRDGGLTATLTLRDDFSILPDHFPGQPILPGMCLVQAVLIAASIVTRDELHLRSLKTAKLMAPVKPGDAVAIDATLTPTDAGLGIRAKLTCNGHRCAELSMTAAPARSASNVTSAGAMTADRSGPFSSFILPPSSFAPKGSPE
jgi:3-hydroxyacyl-[acyl-carrier-protein] dehydratase